MKVYRSKKRWPKILLIVLLAVALGAGVWFGWQWYQENQRQQEREERQARQQRQQEREPRLSVEERFVERYYETDLPGVDKITEPPEITGNSQADKHIRQLAEDRGYRLQFKPNRGLEQLGEEEIQPETASAWQELQQAAEEDGISLGMVSAYRSIRTQQIIFDSQLRQRAEEEQGGPFTAEQIAGGEADQIIENILKEYSIPGYSKHHSGHTIDLTDMRAGAELDDFGETEAFKWLSDNKYANAREHGFLPSYPEGVANLGPDAEQWEFVWVGKDNTQFDE